MTYNPNTDNFRLQVRKDLEHMDDEKDKYLYIHNLNFKLHRDKLIELLLEGKTPITTRFIRKGRKWYLQVIISWWTHQEDIRTGTLLGAKGLDFNNAFIQEAETDTHGNLVNLKHHPLDNHSKGNRALSEMRETISRIVDEAYKQGKSIICEDLNFSKAKIKKAKKAKSDKGKEYNKMIHALDYSRFKKSLINKCHRTGVELIFVNPAYTTKIGEAKFNKHKKLSTHQGAAYVIARKGQGFRDRLPKSPKRKKSHPKQAA